MKEIAILTLSVKNLSEPKTRFMLLAIENLYKNNVRFTVFSRSFDNSFPAYIARKKISMSTNPVTFKRLASGLAKQCNNVQAIIAIDFPMNIIASMLKNILLKNTKIEMPIITWYCFEFQTFLYSVRSIKTKNMLYNNILVKNMLRKLDLEHTSNIDVVIASSKKIESQLYYIHNDIENVEVVYPGFPLMHSVNVDSVVKQNYFLAFNLHGENEIFSCISAYSQYLKMNLENTWLLKILGYSAELKFQISILGLEEKVRIIEHSNAENEKKIYLDANAVIIGRRDSGLNMHLFKCWSSKTAVIVDIHSAEAEIVTNGSDAIVIDTENPLTLADSMKTLSNSTSLTETLAANGHENLKNRFSVNDYAQNILLSLKS